ncbi:MAG: T9SS type A sorting domain-containing protein [Reichenbachiella sp.]
MKSIVKDVFFLITLVVGLHTVHGQTALNTLYTDNATFTIDNAMVSGSTDFTNYVFLVSIETDGTDVNKELRSSGTNGGKIQSAGLDIVFAASTTADDVDRYKYDLESYNAATGEVIVWVQIPTLSATVDTELVMFFGRASAPGWNDPTLWIDANYIGAWQLSQPPGAGTVLDATGYSDPGSTSGGVTIDNTSIVGQGYAFDGINGYVSIPDKAILEPTGSFTISCWFKSAGSQTGYPKIFTKGRVVYPFPSYTLEMRPFDDIEANGSDDEVAFQTARTNDNFVRSDSDDNGVSDITTDEWNYFVGVFEDLGGNYEQRAYLNGVLIQTAIQDSNPVDYYSGDGDYALTIGAGLGPGLNFPFRGTVDELRIADLVRSVDFIKTDMRNTACASNYVTVTSNIPSLSCIDATLPVKFLDFNAYKKEDHILINWSTASEDNNDFFTVEKSFDGVKFQAIGTVAGAGNSNDVLNYQFVDKEISGNLIYYRIKQTDFDGKFDYSKQEKVITTSRNENTLDVYPNPSTCNDKFNIILSNTIGSVSIKLINLSGHIVFEELLNSNNQLGKLDHTIHTTNIQAGVYILKIVDAKSNFTRRILLN